MTNYIKLSITKHGCVKTDVHELRTNEYILSLADDIFDDIIFKNGYRYQDDDSEVMVDADSNPVDPWNVFYSLPISEQLNLCCRRHGDAEASHVTWEFLD